MGHLMSSMNPEAVERWEAEEPAPRQRLPESTFRRVVSAIVVVIGLLLLRGR